MLKNQSRFRLQDGIMDTIDQLLKFHKFFTILRKSYAKSGLSSVYIYSLDMMFLHETYTRNNDVISY